MRIFQDTNQRDIRRSFCREALVWQRLRNFYIVPLIGIDAEGFPPFPCLVSPWMKNGTVLKYLSTLGDHGRQHTVTRLIREIAQGLAYLHDEHVVHGDLRGANILVDDAGRARLKDFGFGGGCVRWMAPETLDPDAFGVQNHPRQPASDIYAFGCVCLELYTGYPPFHDAHVREPVVIYQVVKGVRPNRPAGNIIPDYIWNIMQKCWAQNFADRPSILGILLERGMHDQP
ncbi:kinase-like domain-containing protein [Mycena metata]|uniref:Kinase-like domain-containing protein n=1 Tax=Mycena metata TaxID=1033252 RepID=A0AAD7K6J6_9AGAR|nr:kinase-like domain-containing protein [Mycena metata]